MSEKRKIVIIGGVAGGASAATRARRLSETASIVIVEKGPYVSFANCGLPYHLGGVIQERDALLVQTPQSLKERFNIDVLVNAEAIAIDRNARTVLVRNLITGADDTLTYDALILAPGAEAVRPPLPGLDLPNVFTLQTMSDMDGIIAHVRGTRVKRAAVIGGGFIGVEAAENLAGRGIAVSLIEADRQVLPPLDPEMASPLHAHLRENGIDLRLGAKASACAADGDGIAITLDGGGIVSADLVILAIGVRPRTDLAKRAGLEIGETGAIKVDDAMRTSDSAIYAVGDVVEVTNPVTGLPAFIPLAGPANRQGRIAADQIFGRDSRYRGTIGTSICKVFSLAAGATGASEKLLRRIGRPYQKTYLHPGHHAGYYPGAESISLKVIFDTASGAILGAQAVGAKGVDKRIDVIAASIAAGRTVFDLEHLELAYAPPYGSAKDPVNMAGFIAGNILRGEHRIIHAEEIGALDPARDMLLDVRTVEENAEGRMPNSINIPINELRGRIGELPRDRRIVVYCAVGQRGYVAQRMLTQMGFDAVNLSGGYATWIMSQAAR